VLVLVVVLVLLVVVLLVLVVLVVLLVVLLVVVDDGLADVVELEDVVVPGIWGRRRRARAGRTGRG